ncbi:MAG: hypothetical protein ACREMY_31450, partial [bacterium]
MTTLTIALSLPIFDELRASRLKRRRVDKRRDGDFDPFIARRGDTRGGAWRRFCAPSQRTQWWSRRQIVRASERRPSNIRGIL